MDIEDAIRAHPHLGIPFVLSVLLSVSLLFAFVMQWNQFSILEKRWSGLKEDWEKGSRVKALLRWYVFSPFIAVGRIWKECAGVRFIAPLGLAFGALAWLLYKALERAVA